MLVHMGGGNSIVPSFSGYELGQVQADERAGLQRGQASNMWQGPPGIAGSGAEIYEVLMRTVVSQPACGKHTWAELRLAEVEICRRACRFVLIVMFMRFLPGRSQLSRGAVQGPELRRACPGCCMEPAVDQPFRESVERLCQFSSVIKMCPHRHPA